MAKTKSKNKTDDKNFEPIGKYKETFADFLIWNSLPRFLRGLSVESLQKFGVDDEKLLQLCQIKDNTRFAEAYNISDLARLSFWRRKIKEEGLSDEISPIWAKDLTKNVIYALYSSIMKTGKSEAIKLWLQSVAGWQEKSKLEIDGFAAANLWKKKLGITEEDIISDMEKQPDKNNESV